MRGVQFEHVEAGARAALHRLHESPDDVIHVGARPFARANYIGKFKTLTEDLISGEESQRFIQTVQRLGELKAGELGALNVVLPPNKLTCATRDERGIF